jgi:hypothetical protein
MKPATKPTLADRIKDVHREIDDLIARRIEEVAASAPGIPKASLELMLFTGKVGDCRCDKHKLLERSES